MLRDERGGAGLQAGSIPNCLSCACRRLKPAGELYFLPYRGLTPTANPNAALRAENQLPVGGWEVIGWRLAHPLGLRPTFG